MLRSGKADCVSLTSAGFQTRVQKGSHVRAWKHEDMEAGLEEAKLWTERNNVFNNRVRIEEKKPGL